MSKDQEYRTSCEKTIKKIHKQMGLLSGMLQEEQKHLRAIQLQAKAFMDAHPQLNYDEAMKLAEPVLAKAWKEAKKSQTLIDKAIERSKAALVTAKDEGPSLISKHAQKAKDWAEKTFAKKEDATAPTSAPPSSSESPK